MHLCVDNDEIEIARWLLDHGADVNVNNDQDWVSIPVMRLIAERGGN
jgi:hypothetical protein